MHYALHQDHHDHDDQYSLSNPSVCCLILQSAGHTDHMSSLHHITEPWLQFTSHVDCFGSVTTSLCGTKEPYGWDGFKPLTVSVHSEVTLR